LIAYVESNSFPQTDAMLADLYLTLIANIPM
jgi:hypothetical protein